MRDFMIAARGDRTQADVALAAGVSQQMYSALERHEANPSVPTAKRLAEVLGVDWSLFYSGDDEMSRGNDANNSSGNVVEQ